MTFTVECECNFKVDFDHEELAGAVAECVLNVLECPFETATSLIITTADEIARINKEYRGIDSPTDVLSFPMAEYEHPGDFGPLEDQDDLFDPDSGELVLGDIIICAERVFSQALEYGHSVKREFAFLIVHSMLHLCGFDHMEPGDAKLMEEKQDMILDKMSIFRDQKG